MPRGKAEFVAMDQVHIGSDKDNTPKDLSVSINERSKIPGDPMRNLMSDNGLVDSNIRGKGFTRRIIDEATASIKK